MKSHLRTLELKIVPIGNSRGVRLPKALIEKYAMRESMVLEEREDGLLLRSKKDKLFSWEETYREMARAKEDWSDLDGTLADGLTPGDTW
jgi:antitoxin MazE